MSQMLITTIDKMEKIIIISSTLLIKEGKVMETNIAPGLRFSILDREFKKKLEERAKRMGLTSVQLRVLGELSRLESMGVEEINQRDLEKALVVTHPTMTEIIKRLEKKNAVVCTPSKVDRRYKKINCTVEFKDIHTELREMDWEIFDKICDGIPKKHVQIFLEASEKMLENTEK